MAAPLGNKYYQIRSKDGRNTEYTPISLLEKANEYFQWCLDNPLKKQELVKYKDSFEFAEVDVMRAFSLEGFCNYADIIRQTFLNYEKRKDFLEVTTHVRQIIDNQQFEGAASGFLSANIIARKLGLADKQSNETKISIEQITGMKIKK